MGSMAARAFSIMVEHTGRLASAPAPNRLTAIQVDIADAFRAASLAIAEFTTIGLCLALSIPLRRL